jgi:hypothetical protein
MGGAAVTFLEPTDEPQAEQRYSWSSPSGRTRRRRSRTGRGAWQRAQNRTDASSFSNVGGREPGRRAFMPYE